jgi:16S rRNA (guanine527-N7)-methyltransferase
MGHKDFFRQFLTARFPGTGEALFERFERYHSWLVSENRKINLISRQTAPEEIWTLHFLDSLLSTRFVDFGGRTVLDFGTGGGLPGLPLAVAFGDASVTLLDSRKKKIAAVKGAAEFLGVGNCRFLDCRLEELVLPVGGGAGAVGEGAFDVIVSRSVKIEPAYKPILMRLLKPRGKLVLYKSRLLDDVRQFDDAEIFDAGVPELGERKIVVITK